MSKGVISLLAYPESANIDNILSVFQGSGAETAYILHDKDTWLKDSGEHKAGEHKKDHWHILCGYETGFPKWKTIKEMCRSCGAVAVSPAECIVKDFDKAVEYLVHKNHPDKHQYSVDEVVYSDDWALDMYKDYIYLRDSKSKKNKSVAKSSLWDLITLIQERGFFEFYQVTDWIRSESPELFDTFMNNQQFVKNYVTSLRMSLKESQAICEHIKQLENKIESQAKLIHELESENFRTSEELTQTKNLLKILYEMNGDNAPQIYEF